VGVVSVPFKATSSDLNRVSYGYFGWFGWKGLKYPKRNIIKRREPRDVIAQAQASKRVEVLAGGCWGWEFDEPKKGGV
jgi:hypothetical protein